MSCDISLSSVQMRVIVCKVFPSLSGVEGMCGVSYQTYPISSPSMLIDEMRQVLNAVARLTILTSVNN